MKVYQEVSFRKSKVEMTQTITIPSRDDILELTKIPDPFLIDELKARGYLVEKAQDTQFTSSQYDSLLKTTLKYLASTNTTIEEYFAALLSKAYELTNCQRKAASIVGISPRMFNYYVKKGVVTRQLSERPKLCEFNP